MKRLNERRHVRFDGFTLIEILIVIFIISIVTSVALLTIGHNENKKMETFAKELTQVVSLAEEQAMLQPNILGIAFNDGSLQFLKYAKERDQEVWVPVDDDNINKINIPKGINIKVKVQNKRIPESSESKGLPQIVFSTNGDITPFTIEVGKKGEKPRHLIIGEADGHLIEKNIS